MENIIVGQSGGPTAVINSSIAGLYTKAKELKIKKVYGMLNGIEGLLEEKIIDLDEYLKDKDAIELLKRTPSAFLGSCRYKLPKIEESEETYEKIFKILEKNKIDAFFYIGGNDSMDTIKMLSDYAQINKKPQKFIGIPKTIDNDLPITDHCPGYGSAAKYIATSIKEIIRDNESFGLNRPTVCIVEIMGRHAGWLTASSSLSKSEDCTGPDAIYLPEVPFNIEEFINRVKKLAKEKSSIVIAVSEGIATEDGTFICELNNSSKTKDAFGHKQLSGCASTLAEIISKETGLKTRPIEFSTLQRAASHIASLTDINESFEVGSKAISSAIEGKTGMMVTIKRKSNNPYKITTELYDIHKIANIENKIPMTWIDKENCNLKKEYIKYASPLIQGELLPIFKNGLPTHLVRKQ